MILGSGEYCYQVIKGWGQGPDGRTLGIATGVAVDSQDKVYVVDREPNPAVVVYDRDGRVLSSWGEDFLSLPHEIFIDSEDRLYIADCGDHTVRICTTEGQILKMLGTPGKAGAPGEPFNMPTRAVLSPSGDIYVSDGYGQHQIHQFSPDGILLNTWGKEGAAPGQFTLPHNVFTDREGRVLVADRETNNRIQIFDPDGGFLSEWPGRLGPCGLYIDADDTVYIAEGGGVSIFNRDGKLLTCWNVLGGPDDMAHGAHGIWVDRHGDIYIGEVGVENLLHKFVRVPGE